ncbi:hypothetical protein ACFQ12_11870, partial [Methylobacterium trifolii]
AAVARLGPMHAAATLRAGAEPEHLVIDKPCDANATVLTEQLRGIAYHHPQIAVDGVTGAVLAETGTPRLAA